MPFPEDEGVTRSEAAAYLLDQGSNRAYALGGRPVGIGRDPVNYIALREATVSRFHGEVRYDPTAGSFTFHSMGAHGSTVNGKAVSESGVALTDGDILGIQGTALRFTTARPPAPYRVVARDDQVPTSPSMPTPPLPLQRSVEPPTTGLETTDPRSVSSRGRWRAAWLIALVAAAIVVGLILMSICGDGTRLRPRAPTPRTRGGLRCARDWLVARAPQWVSVRIQRDQGRSHRDRRDCNHRGTRHPAPTHS